MDSPFQTLVATEFASAEKLSRRATIILMPARGRLKFDIASMLAQMEEVAALYPWGRVISFPAVAQSHRERIKHALSTASHLHVFRNVDTLVVGNIKTSFDLFLSAISPPRVVLLDDGLRTLDFVANAKAFHDIPRSRMRRLAFGRPYDFLANANGLETFTFIDAVANGSKRNELSWTRALLEGIPLRDEVWVVGQPLVETGLLTEECYRAVLNAPGAVTGKVGARYFPHARELSSLAAERARSFGAQVAIRSLPIELEPVSREYIPAYVVGVASTALATMRRVFPSECRLSLCSVPAHDVLPGTTKTAFLRSQDFLQSDISGATHARRSCE